MLDAIKNKRLKKVEENQKERTQSFGQQNNSGVAAILMRRVAVEFSDSDDSGTDDSDEWSDGSYEDDY